MSCLQQTPNHCISNQHCIHSKYETPSGTATHGISSEPAARELTVGSAGSIGGCKLDLGIDQLPKTSLGP